MSDHQGNFVFRLYLREIRQLPRLTPEEELDLTHRIRQGDDTARGQLVLGNLRLVVRIAHDFTGRGLPLLDLISEGNLGLMKAAQRHDPNQGGRFSTYAAIHIRQAMRRAIANQSRLVRLPVFQHERLSRLNRAEWRLHTLLDRKPTDREIAQEAGFSIQQAHLTRLAALHPLSLEANRYEDSATRIVESVPDPSQDRPGDQLEQEEKWRLIEAVTAGLPPRELEALRHRFGLDDGQTKSFYAVGLRMGVSRERARQLHNSALKKLRQRLRTMTLLEGSDRYPPRSSRQKG